MRVYKLVLKVYKLDLKFNQTWKEKLVYVLYGSVARSPCWVPSQDLITESPYKGGNLAVTVCRVWVLTNFRVCFKSFLKHELSVYPIESVFIVLSIITFSLDWGWKILPTAGGFSAQLVSHRRSTVEVRKGFSVREAHSQDLIRLWEKISLVCPFDLAVKSFKIWAKCRSNLR